MAGNFPFTACPGNTIGFTAGVASQSRLVQQSDIGLNYFPTQVRIRNAGTVDIWVWFSSTSTVLAIPVPGTTTVGTPSKGIPIVPGVLEVFTLSNFQLGTLYVSDISTSANQNYFLTFGEGL
jgi:hypothetical protein